jgi:hypothetical protein
MGLLAMGLLSFGLNIPLGIWRSKVKKFSVAWFVAIHLTVPLIYFLRTTMGLPSWSAPILIAAAVLGQLVGGALPQAAARMKSEQYKEV